MVGDNLWTDILGANQLGYSSALVYSGTTTAANLSEMIKRSRAKPTHVCDKAALQCHMPLKQ